MLHLVLAAVLLRPVADELEPANNLADGEETNNLGSNDTDGCPLCSRHSTDLGEHVLRRRVAGFACDAVEQGRRVAEGVQRRLHVCLHLLDGAVQCYYRTKA